MGDEEEGEAEEAVEKGGEAAEHKNRYEENGSQD